MKKKALKKSLAGFMVAIFFFLPLLSLPTVTILAYEEYQENGNTYIFGEITENTTWTSENSPYVVTGNITVAENKTLTVEPGAEIRFDGYDKKMTIKGTLSAIGDKDNYIIFTSNQDNPNYWSWRGVELNGDANSEIKYAVIEYASTGIYSDYSSESSINLENSILRNLGTGVSNIKNSNISYNDFLDINNTVFISICGNTNITHNHISGKYRTVFNGIQDTTNIKYNNINISKNIEWFIDYAYNNTNFENNYWGTDDKDYIQSYIHENAINNGVSFEPYFSIPVTFDLVVPENNFLVDTSPTSTINFSWNPINGPGDILEYYKLYIDSELKETNIIETNIDYDISLLSDGYHSWYVVAVKSDGDSYKSNDIFGFNKNITTPHTPVASSAGGWYSEDQNIILSAAESDIIRYTLDGSDPTETSETSFEYISPVFMEAVEGDIFTLKAKAWDSENSSPIMTEEYQFDLTLPEVPVADPIGGVYNNLVSVSLNSPDSAVIRYTTNGIEPTEYSDKYLDKIQINNSTVLKAVAWDEHGNKSAIMEEAYFIENSGGGGGGYYYPDLKILPDQGAYIESSGSKTISLTANEETAKICYTVDGSEPTEDSTCIDDKTADVDLTTGNTTLKTRVWSTNGSMSGVFSKEYFIYDHGTYITESIYGETTWDIVGSPYIVKKNTMIGINNKLMIEPGTEVILNNYARLESHNGKIEALGNSNNLITIKNVGYIDNWQSNINISNSKLDYVKLENINLYSNNSSIVSNSILDNSVLQSNLSEIKNNKFRNSENLNSCEPVITIWDDVNFFNNYIEIGEIMDRSRFCSDGSPVIKVIGSNISILRNEFIKTDDSSRMNLFGIYSGNNIRISNNNFNFDFFDETLLVKNNSEMKVDMRNNYWKGVNENNIPTYIYDYYDDENLGEVYYNTYAGSKITFDLIYPHDHTLNNSDINFQWEPLAGNDIDYYKLYIDNNLVADNITATNYNYSGILEDESYTWYVSAVKKDGTILESRQNYTFIIDNTSDKVIAQPNGGTYITNQTVTLGYPEENATIRYTLDGRDPTESSAIYTEPIKIESKGTTILKSKAWYGANESEISVEEYNINTTPPNIIDWSVILYESSSNYDSGSMEGALRGIVGEVEPNQNQAVGLTVEIDKPAVCKYSISEKEFSSINDYWYNSEEGIFKSAHGTATELIAPLGGLSDGDYKYFVICSDGVDEIKITMEFSKQGSSIETGSVLSPSSICSTRSIAVADNSWGNGWQWIFDITVPDEESNFKMKFNDWHNSNWNHSISVANNMRYYSPQAEIASNAENAIIITQAEQYPVSLINLAEDINQNKEGKQIQILVDMKLPKGTPNGSYFTNYGLYSE